MAHHVFKRSQNIPDKRLLHPKRDWFIGILIFLAVLCVGSISSVYSFLSFQNINLEGLVTEKDIAQYREQLVQNQLLRFEDRKALYEVLRNQAPVVIEEEASETASSTATSTGQVQSDESEVSTDIE